MLALRRKEGQWLEVVHRPSGEMFRFRVYQIDGRRGTAQLAFDNPDRNFEFRRPEAPRRAVSLTGERG